MLNDYSSKSWNHPELPLSDSPENDYVQCEDNCPDPNLHILKEIMQFV